MKLSIKKGEPFRLADGTEIVPSVSDGEQKYVTTDEREVKQELDEVLEDPFDNELDVSFKRSLADVQSPASEMNPVMLVLAYSLWGLDPHAIARLLDQSLENVEHIIDSELFATSRREMIESIRHAETSAIMGYLAQKAYVAARVVATEMRSKDGDRRLAAAKDVLDRSGFRPNDRVEHVHKFDDDLRIVVTNTKPMPTIDVFGDS